MPDLREFVRIAAAICARSAEEMGRAEYADWQYVESLKLVAKIEDKATREALLGHVNDAQKTIDTLKSYGKSAAVEFKSLACELGNAAKEENSPTQLTDTLTDAAGSA